MAINPMQRRARNSFIQGALITLVIMLVVVLWLVREMRSINDAKEALEKANTKVLVAADDLKSGETINFDEDFMMETVRTNVPTGDIIGQDDFELKDDEGNLIGEKELKMKIDVPAGTIVTKKMVYEANNKTEDSDRIQEYNMIVLPSKLKNGDFIDIRLTMPSGQDFIVLPKKEVIGTTETSLWIKVNEQEILTMNSAIVEAYVLPGTKLYAIPYVEAGMQNASIQTYQVGKEIVYLIEKNPNILPEAINNFRSEYDSELRVGYIDSQLFNYQVEQENRDSAVKSGFQEEIQAIREDRAEFVKSLEGTEEIGFNQ